MIKAKLYPSQSWKRERQFQLRLTGTESALSFTQRQMLNYPNLKLHVSAGLALHLADEPDTLIIGDSAIKDITGKKIKTCYFLDVMVIDINQKLATIILENPKISQIIVHAGFNDIRREQSELLKRDYTQVIHQWTHTSS